MTLKDDILAVCLRDGYAVGLRLIADEYHRRAVSELLTADSSNIQHVAKAQESARIWREVASIPDQISSYAERIGQPGVSPGQK